MADHVPVLANEILALMRETPIPVSRFLDGTFGRGGHAHLVMKNFPKVQVVAIDQDIEAINYGREHFREKVDEKRVCFIHSNFTEVKEYWPQISEFTGGEFFSSILLDLGVSSPQLDEAERGFSFYKDGPLDMRMNRDQKLSARDIVNSWSEGELVDLFQNLGEVQGAKKVARIIVSERKKKLFESTLQLSSLIERMRGWGRRGHHPATQFFLALRLVVNKELEVVDKVLPNLLDILEEGGRLFVITFHSLEDRIVKRAFKSFKSQGSLVNKKVIQAQWEEKKVNPRSRSAKLRVFQKGVTL